LLMIDIDSFKMVNDTFGHLVGNKVLTHIGRILEKTVRNTDFVFRCGGDEFGVVLPGTELEGALHVAEKIIEKVEAGGILPSLGYSGAVTVSIGAAQRDDTLIGPSLVIRAADEALYRAKHAGRNRVMR